MIPEPSNVRAAAVSPGAALSRSRGAPIRQRPLAALLRVLPALLLLATAPQGCRSTARTAPPPDPAPVVGVWSGREGRPFGRFREWRLELKPENLLQPGQKATPGAGQYTEGGVVCEVQFLANYYQGAVPRINLAIAGRSKNCDLQRFTLYAALPIADTMVGQLSEDREDQYASVTFRRSASARGTP